MAGCRLILNPGVCGFECEVEAIQEGRGRVRIRIDSQCAQISKLKEFLDVLDLPEIFVSPNKNRVFLLSGNAGCHASCPVPAGILKCAEVALGLALPRDVTFHFE